MSEKLRKLRRWQSAPSCIINHYHIIGCATYFYVFGSCMQKDNVSDISIHSQFDKIKVKMYLPCVLLGLHIVQRKPALVSFEFAAFYYLS